MSRSGLLRVGLVGLGMMGRNHARVLADLDDVDFVGIAEVDSAACSGARGRPTMPTVHDLLRQNLDACILAVPTSQHLELALPLAEAGVVTLIEKPLASSVREAQQLKDAFESSGTAAAVGHIERFNPSVLELKQRLADGEGGAVHQVVTRRVGPRPHRVKDVGVVKDLATHDLDLTMHLTSSTYATIAAQGTNTAPDPTAADTSAETPAPAASAHEDLVAITGRLYNGAVANHTVNWITPQKERHVSIACQHGTWTANTLTGDLLWSEQASEPSEWPAVSTIRGPREGQVTKLALAKREPLRVELEQFARLARGEPNDSVSLDDGLEVVRVAERVLEAMTSQGTITC